MSFFESKLGEDAKNNDGNFDSNARTVIPDGTQCLAYVADVSWDNGNAEFDMERHIKIQWSILSPEYKGLVLFQKVRVESPKEQQQKKAWQMLQAIDTNAGGAIAKLKGDLDDNALQKALQQKPMMIQIAKWEMNGGEGNWVRAVAPKGGAVVEIPAPVTTPFSSDDIPF